VGKKRRLEEQERLEQQKKKRQKQIIIGALLSVCTIAVIVVLSNLSKPVPASIISSAPDSNGDLRVAVDSLKKGMNYIEFGSNEELIFFKDNDGAIKTAFDTCEECYARGNVRFTLSEDILTCSVCGTTQSISILGTESWGGCKPLSITSDMRNDTDAEVVIPAAVLSYSNDMFSQWDTSDFSISLAGYGASEEGASE